jgi:hypothetical protein
MRRRARERLPPGRRPRAAGRALGRAPGRGRVPEVAPVLDRAPARARAGAAVRAAARVPARRPGRVRARDPVRLPGRARVRPPARARARDPVRLPGRATVRGRAAAPAAAGLATFMLRAARRALQLTARFGLSRASTRGPCTRSGNRVAPRRTLGSSRAASPTPPARTRSAAALHAPSRLFMTSPGRATISRKRPQAVTRELRRCRTMSQTPKVAR